MKMIVGHMNKLKLGAFGDQFWGLIWGVPDSKNTIKSYTCLLARTTMATILYRFSQNLAKAFH